MLLLQAAAALLKEPATMLLPHMDAEQRLEKKRHHHLLLKIANQMSVQILSQWAIKHLQQATWETWMIQVILPIKEQPQVLDQMTAILEPQKAPIT